MSGGFEGPGERLTAQYLASHLPDDWVIVFNKEVPRRGVSREVDAIVVGNHAVFVLEEKHWHGIITGNEDRWVLGSGESRGSPLNQAKTANQFVHAFLEAEIPGYSQRFGAGQPRKALESAVVISGDAEVRVSDPRAARWVLPLNGCEVRLLDVDRQHRGGSIESIRDAIVERLTTLADQPRVPSRIQNYEVIEVERENGWSSSFRARHEGGDERVLRLIWKPQDIDESVLARRKEVLMREHEALSRLRDSGVVPRLYDWFDWHDGDAWIFPMDPPRGRSLRASSLEGLPSEEDIRSILPAAFDALARLHHGGIIHRGITPDRVFIEDGRVMFVDFQVARIPEIEVSVADMVSELDPDNRFGAPECAADASLASSASDVYSLSASLMCWITGMEPAGESSWPPQLALERPELPRRLAESLEVAFSKGLESDRARRPSAEIMRDELLAACGRPPQGRYPQGARLDNGRYEVMRELGQGATAVTYLAEDSVSRLRVVLKQLVDPRLVSLALQEYQNLRSLRHPNLIEVLEVYPPEHEFHLKLEYVPGDSLASRMADSTGSVDRVVKVGLELANALTYLSQQDFLHRDISPKNIIVPDDESLPIKLIDFGLSRSGSDTSSAVGTPRYRAPEIDAGGTWHPGCDLYSVAVILFEMLTGRLPFELDEGVLPNKQRPVDLSQLNLEGVQRSVAEVLLMQCSPDPDDRSSDPEEFARVLQAAATEVISTSPPKGAELINPWVDQIRGLYRNSRTGNSDNRGLDSPFAHDTYVPTALDDHLLPSLQRGAVRLLILSGNPGDGKTAFLRRTLQELQASGATEVEQDEAGWRARLGDSRLAAVYDASESHGQLTADDLVRNALAPLAGTSPPEDRYTAMVAVNDGRLLSFFERFGEGEFPWVWDRIQPQLMGDDGDRDGVLLVDLKRRSLSGGSDVPLFERLLDPLVHPDKWSMCGGCAAREECPMLFNAKSFGAGAPHIRAQLGSLLTATHLRRERRPTIRDLRSALAYLITQDLSCSGIHAERAAKHFPLSQPGRPYFNAVFAGDREADLLLDQWRLLDPATIPTPSLDRFLHYHREPSELGKVRALFVTLPERSEVAALALRDAAWFEAMKRRYFFEGVREPEENFPTPSSLLAYRYLEAFTEALSETNQPDDVLLQRLLTGIGRADGVPASAAAEGLSLRTREDDDASDDVVVIKRFPLDEFSLSRPARGSAFIEAIPDELTILYRDGHSTLSIGLDLFEFLGRTADGLTPGVYELRPMLEDLAVFKHQLLAWPTERAFISEAGRRIHEIVASRGNLILGGGE